MPSELNPCFIDSQTGQEKRARVNSRGEIIVEQSNTTIAYATKIQTSGSNTYIAQAIPGTTQSEAKWQAYMVDTNGSITWADGNANFDNTATDLTSLSYS